VQSAVVHTIGFSLNSYGVKAENFSNHSHLWQ